MLSRNDTNKTQKLNHFDDSDQEHGCKDIYLNASVDDSESRAWLQRYYVNASVWIQNGQVFMMIGGEGSLNPYWLTFGSMAEYAKEYGFLTLALEHRFYGESRPLGYNVVYF